MAIILPKLKQHLCYDLQKDKTNTQEKIAITMLPHNEMS